MDIETFLNADQSREKANGPSAGNENDPRAPLRSRANTLNLFPGLRHNTCRFKQNAETPHRAIDLYEKLRPDTKSFGAVSMSLFDAAFGISVVATHIPLAGCARDARHGIGPA